jgi:hypothetical protein
VEALCLAGEGNEWALATTYANPISRRSFEG